MIGRLLFRREGFQGEMQTSSSNNVGIKKVEEEEGSKREKGQEKEE